MFNKKQFYAVICPFADRTYKRSILASQKYNKE